MTSSDLISAVKFILDEVTPTGVTHPIDNYMDEAIKSAFRDLIQTAPKYLLPLTQVDYPADGESAIVENSNAYIPVPDDFRRLYKIRFSTWGRDVEEYISEGNPDYLKYQNKFLKPGRAKPIVVLVNKILGDDTTPTNYFECFSTGEASEFGSDTLFMYIADSVDPADYSNKLLKPTAHLVAYYILMSIEEFETAKAAYQDFLKILATVSQ